MRAFCRRWVAVGCALLALAGCGTPDLGEGLVDLRPVDADPCWPEDGRTLVGGTEEVPVTVVVLGEGTEGVLLLPGSGPASYCEWAELAQRLVDQGYLVASFSWAPADSRISALAGAAALQDDGARSYAMIGSSKGGADAVIRARELDPPPVGVIGLSPSYVPQPEPGDPTYDGPLLVIASTNDSVISTETSRAVARADDPSTYVELSGWAHGTSLLRNEHQDAVENLIDDFLAEAFDR